MIAWILFGLVVAFVLVDAARLRAKVRQLHVLVPASADSADFLTFPAEIPADVRQSAIEFARAEDLGLVDLLPANLPTTAALDLLRAVDPKTYRDSRWVRGVSVGEAMLCGHEAIADLGIRQPRDTCDFVSVARRVKDREGVKADLAIAPTLPTTRYNLATRAARLRREGKRPALWALGSVLGYLTVLGATVWTYPWGVIAAILYCAHPLIVFVGTPLRPKDLLLASALRSVHTPYLWARTLGSRWQSAAECQQEQEVAEATPAYQEEISRGTTRFFEPRRESCPDCDAPKLEVCVRSGDLVQRKPGRFTLERCVTCGHVFQNPRLTSEGLDFYYRDFYDGLGAAGAETVFAWHVQPYYDRARMVQQVATPKRWLDVGSGHAHFCLGAKEILPDTQFDGLDQGAAIEDAVKLGRIQQAYRGSLTEFAGELRGRYDVISMHHYLEHTRDPWDELATAAEALPTGGYLLIEVPDPEWGLGKLFGKYWMPWFQPQHQHMLPIGNLKHALAERGLRTVAEERAKAHMCNDFALSSFLLFASLAPRSPTPWRPAKPRLQALRNAAVWSVGIPCFLAAKLLDSTVNRIISQRLDGGNAYRVLARKETV